MLEIVVGSLLLFLGWLCFGHVSRVRALYSTERSPRSRFYGEKPPMIFAFALGVLFVLDGLALLALTAYERLHVTELILALVFITALALMRTATGSRRNKQRAGRQKSRAGKGADLFLAGK